MTPLTRQDDPAAQGMGSRVAAGGTPIRRYVLAPAGADIAAAVDRSLGYRR
jgi:hypothetical protein